MSNEKNLVRPSSIEARENGRKGGAASGEARRKKKTFGAIMGTLSDMSVTDEHGIAMPEKTGFDKDGMTHDAILTAGLLNRAKQGMYNLMRTEQETVIRWDTETRLAYIDTADPVTIRKLDKLVANHPDAYRCVRADAQFNARQYEVHSQFVRFARPPSEAQRAANRTRALRYGFKAGRSGASEEADAR